MALCSPIQSLWEANLSLLLWELFWKRPWEHQKGFCNGTSYLRNFVVHLRALFSKRAQVFFFFFFYYPNGLIAISISRTSSQSPAPRVYGRQSPRKLIFRASEKQRSERVVCLPPLWIWRGIFPFSSNPKPPRRDGNCLRAGQQAAFFCTVTVCVEVVIKELNKKRLRPALST